MNFSQLLDEVKSRGEKIKREILDEVVKSKTLNLIVSNENFVRAVSSMIATKREVKKVLDRQVKSLIKTMEVVTKRDLSQVLVQIKNVEKAIENLLRDSFLKKQPTTKTNNKTSAKKHVKRSAKKKPAKKK